MLKKSLILSVVLAALVNCSNDKSKSGSMVQSVPSDTPTEFINDNGDVIDSVDPANDPNNQPPAPSTDEMIKDAWIQLGFGKEFLMTELMGPDICSLGEKQFVGCFFAASYLTTYAYGPDHVLVISGQQDEEFIGELVFTAGFLSVHKKPESKVDLDDAQAASQIEKRSSEFFKKSVQAAINAYKTKIEGNAGVASVIRGYKQEFPKSMKTLETALRGQDEQGIAKAQRDMEDIVNGINSNREFLAKTLFDPYMEIVSKAFDKIPETDRGIQARYTYNEYLRHSADGHARIDLHDRFKEALAEKSSTPAVEYGIGAEVRRSATGIYLSPLAGSSAEKSDVQENDRVLTVNGVQPLDVNDAVQKIKGPRDTEVTIVVERWADKAQKTLVVQRAPIQVKTHTLQTKVINGKTYGMLKIATFMDDEMADAVRAFVSENDTLVDGYIMDLRNNGGGLLTQAVELCDVFLPKNTPVVAESSPTDPDVMDFSKMKLTTKGQATSKNLIVLINGRSASASEIVSGVLQEHKRAIIMGTQSFGKGTVQRSDWMYHPDVPEYEVWGQFATMQMTPMGPRKFSLVNFYKTVGRYFFPSGRTPEWVGVTPDVLVSANPLEADMFSPREQDVFPFSFGDLGVPWVQERPELVTKIQECVSTQGRSTKTWSSTESKKPFLINFQERYAYDALLCI